MKILIAVFAALALSACASPPASNAPALAASTSKAPYDYAMCVLPKWQRQAPGVALVEEGRGYRLADAGQWLEVQPARGGSLVRIHEVSGALRPQTEDGRRTIICLWPALRLIEIKYWRPGSRRVRRFA